MSSTTMHFGPEWMRTKHQTPTRTQPPPSPPPSGAPLGASTYSALVSAPSAPQTELHDEVHPFRYSKEELLRIYREGGGKAGLGLEVERWEGVVREVGSDPVWLREPTEAEKKLFQGPLNSDLRRRQSTDFLSPLATQGLNNNTRMGGLNSPGATGGSPLTNRFGGLRRRDSGADQTTGMLPRKQSLTGLQQPLQSPRDAALPSPRRGSGFQHGFDGILGGGESWMSRRRASEATLKAGAPRDGDQTDNKTSDILEEVDEEGNPGSKQDNQPPGESKRDASVADAKDSLADQRPTVNSELANPGLTGSNAQGVQPATPAAATPPIDYASVEWSYRDPTGQVQGPFRAELMQKWYDDGYFTGDLPMRRTHLDTDWITVDDLKLRHGGLKIFITPPVPSLPPGLAPRTDSPQQAGTQQDVFNSPFQPAPLRNLRSATLDGFGSTASNSPSSSYGGRFSNGSPDPQAFGGRAAYYNPAESSARVQPFLGVDPSNSFSRRNELSFDTLGARSTAFASNMANRAGSLDGFGFNRTYSPGANAWNAPVSNIGLPFDEVTGAFPANYGSSVMNQFGGLGQENAFVDVSAFQQNMNYNVIPNGATYSPAPQHAAPQQIQQQISGTIQNPQHVASQSSQPASTAGSSPAPASYQSLWSNDLPPPRKPGPFDAAHPTAANTIAIQPISPSPWGPPSDSSRPGSQPTNESPWSTAPKTIPQATTSGPASDTKPEPIVVEEVTTEVQDQKPSSPIKTAEKAAEQPPTPVTKPEPEPTVTAPPAPTTAQAPKITKSKSKGSTPQVEKKQQQQAPPIQTEQAQSQVPTPVTASTPKTPWSIDEDAKMKTSGSTMSLREIQEAEEKKAEARKAAEREKERAARAAAQAAQAKDSKENVQPFTTSWGLPTSQAGGKTTTVSKESSSPTPSTPGVNAAPAPAWTTAAATTKKTMKEIQEEEEKRKKNVAKETVAAAAARRAYADTTQKTTTPATSQGAWTTIGANGKPSGPPPAVRPTTSTSTSTPTVASVVKTNGVTVTPRPPATITATAKTTTPAPKFDEPVSPSVDFLKWLSSALKGLNSTVNVEEIISMLLSFPMDPDASTVEIISELIYANSTTLDGRRFASEFISKRKADAATRPKGASSAGKAAVKPVSIAEVVKATPKPTQPEWGFKVVNKKKKGGKA